MSCDVVAAADCSFADSHPTDIQSENAGLGYSRHYAQRIRDLGQTSKDSWITRLWNHMFGSNSASNKKSNVKNEDAKHSVNVNSLSGGSSRRPSDYVDDRCLQSHTQSSAPVVFSESNDVKKYHHVSHTDKHDVVVPIVHRQTRSTNELGGRVIPQHLVNSPYLPVKEKIVYYRPVLTAKPNNPNDGVVAAKLRYERLSKSSTALRSSFPSSHADTNDELHKSRSLSHVKRQTFKRDAAAIQMEKRAKAVADRAILVGTLSYNCILMYIN